MSLPAAAILSRRRQRRADGIRDHFDIDTNATRIVLLLALAGSAVGSCAFSLPFAPLAPPFPLPSPKLVANGKFGVVNARARTHFDNLFAAAAPPAAPRRH